MKQKVSGIYGIEDVKTGNLYVGHSKDIAKRWSNHASNFKDNKHLYKKLQNAYNDDCKRIKYTILEECKSELLKSREDFWMKYIQKIDGWTLINIQQHGGATKTVKDTTKMCTAQTGESNGHCTKLNKEKVKQIKIYQKNNTYSDDELANIYNVSLTHIINIRKGKRWGSVKINEKVIPFGEDITHNSTFGDVDK